jgi:hypothetical protein
MMTATQLIARARSQLGKKTRYKLGGGGYGIDKPRAGGGGGHDPDQCDCSGFVCWALNISRMTSNEYYKLKLKTEWISTVSMFADCGDSAGLFRVVDGPQVGCIIVYPDGALGKRKQGHVGIVTQVEQGSVKAIIHCSAGNFNKGDAIAENLDATWQKMMAKSRFGWFVGLK